MGPSVDLAESVLIQADHADASSGDEKQLSPLVYRERASVTLGAAYEKARPGMAGH